MTLKTIYTISESTGTHRRAPMRDDDYDAHQADEKRDLQKLQCTKACKDCRRCVEQMKRDVIEMEQVRLSAGGL